MSEAFEQSKKLIILTILYNLVEGIFALYFGLESNSTSLLSFGLDSFIEITASGIALWGVTSKNETSHNQAEKLIAYSFLLLIVFILIKLAAPSPPQLQQEFRQLIEHRAPHNFQLDTQAWFSSNV